MKNIKVIILKGCPCSGKSTYAANKDAVKADFDIDDYEIVNRDTIRDTYFEKYKYSKENEQHVIDIEKQLIFNAVVNNNNHVIIDDTNLNQNTIDMWREFIKEINVIKGLNVTIYYKEFYIPYAEAIKRSKARRDAGGLFIPKNVMLNFYKKYYNERFEDELKDKRIIKEPNGSLPDCVICDLDATLALHQGREPFDWSRINEDIIDPRLMNMLYVLYSTGIKILFVTGRPDSARDATVKWLDENFGHKVGKITYELFTRANNDFSHGDDYKRKIYKDNVENKYNVLAVFEDSNKCVSMWREEGLLTCQVENSDF